MRTISRRRSRVQNNGKEKEKKEEKTGGEDVPVLN
jgi:hypothetical protein